MSLALAPVQHRQTTGNAQNKGLLSYVLIGVLVLICTGLFYAHVGRILNLGFPLLATIVAALLYRLHRSAYVAFVWWIWLFTPEVRRLVDYQSAYHSVSPVMVTPLLVTGLVFMTILKRPRFLLRRFMLPFGLFGGAVLFAFAVGIFENGFLPAAFEFAGLIIPAAFGMFLIMDQREYEQNRDAVVFASLTGLIIISAYGLYQFYNLPVWDSFWLTNSKLTSAGKAFAEQVRIFGPLNSPGPYGAVLMASLIFLLVARGNLRIPAAVLGFPALALCEVRAAWGGLAIGALMVVWRLGGKAKLRLILFFVVAASIAEPIVTVGPFASIVANRFATLSDIQQDDSFHARESLYETFFTTAFSVPIGAGLGQLGVAAKLSSGQTVNFDSGLLEIPYEFGWVGGALISWSIILISWRALKIYFRSPQQMTIGAAAVFFSVLSTIISGPVFGGVNGVLFWAAGSLAIGYSRNGEGR